ncbi:MAG: Flp pilus assembly protein CpaB [Pseudomonadota bacterium]
MRSLRWRVRLGWVLALGVAAAVASAQGDDLLPLSAGQRMAPVAVEPAIAELLSANGPGAEVALFNRTDDGTLVPIDVAGFVLGIEGGDVVMLEVSPEDAVSLARVQAKGDVIVQLTGLPDADAVAARRADASGADGPLELSDGLRAFSIRTDMASGVVGFLRPGDIVDVYWTGGRDDQAVTRLIASSLRLIAIDDPNSEDATGARVSRIVTVEAEPNVVAVLAHGQSTGRLSLALRGAADQGSPSEIEVDQNNLLGVVERPTPEVSNRCTIRTRRGNEVVEIDIPCPGAGPRGEGDGGGSDWPGPRTD